MAERPASKRPTQRRPTASQMDEKIVVPLDPIKFLEGVLHAGPHPEDDLAKTRPKKSTASPD